MAECALCKRETPQVVNIDFEAVPLCEGCCRTITLQTVTTLVSDAPWPGCSGAESATWIDGVWVMSECEVPD